MTNTPNVQSESWAKTWQLAVAAVLTGMLWPLACADFDIWPLGWVAMTPTLWIAIKAPTRKSALCFSLLAGTLANAGGFYWVSGLLERFGNLPTPVAYVGLLGLAAYQGLAFMVMAWGVRSIRTISKERLGKPLPFSLLGSVLIAGIELVHPVVFPFYLAITQAWVVPVIQIADITGPVGVSALLVMTAGLLLDVAERKGKPRIRVVIANALVMAFVLGYGQLRIHQTDAARALAPKINVGIVQANISFDQKGRNAKAPAQLAALRRETDELAAKGADFIVWSETVYPFRLPRDMKTDLAADSPYRIRGNARIPMLIGAVTGPTGESEIPPYNSAIMFDAEGRVQGIFDKVFLLIFGEYTPLADQFEFVRKAIPKAAGHFSRGEHFNPLPLRFKGKEYRIGAMICYEDIIADFGRKIAKSHPHMLVNLTNDAWFGETSEPWEHMALSVYRTVELRTDMVRSVNTGVSAIIDANGRVLAETYAVDPSIHPKGVDSLLGEAALLEGGHTFYSRFGNVFGWLCVILSLLAWPVWKRIP